MRRLAVVAVLMMLAGSGVTLPAGLLAGCGGSKMTADQKTIATVQTTLEAGATALGALDLQRQHAILADVVAKHGTQADFAVRIKLYRDARNTSVLALKEALAAVKDAAKSPTEATLASLAIAASNFYHAVVALDASLKGAP